MIESELIKCIEKTISNGYHIFLTSKEIYSQKKIKVNSDVEIEIFSANRYIATAPSIGYTPMGSNNSCIYLKDAYSCTINSVDLDHFCNKFQVEEKKESDNKKVELNDEFLFDEENWDRLTKKWDSFNAFMEGKTDTDWDNISKHGSSYDFIRYNILPAFALFDKIPLFLKTIKQYGNKYLKQWQLYPIKWQEDYKNDIVIMGKELRQRLYKLGFFKKEKTIKTKQDLIEDFVTEQMPRLFKYVLVMYDAIYYYSDTYHCYIYLEKNTFNEVLCMNYTNKLGIILKPEEYTSLQETFNIYAKIFSVDVVHTNYISYDLLKDNSYHNKLSIVFKNGTLYMSKESTVFKEKEFNPYDKALFSVQIDYTDKLFEENPESVIMQWFKTKFSDKYLDFIQMFFGNLLVPSYNSSVMLVLYSYKGALGKSTLAKTLSSLFDINSNAMITTFPLTRLNDRFGGSS